MSNIERNVGDRPFGRPTAKKAQRAQPQLIDRFNLTREQLDEGYLRVSGIVAPNGLLPIGRSTWHDWVARGKVAAGIKLSRGVTVWPRAYVANLVLTLQQGGE